MRILKSFCAALLCSCVLLPYSAHAEAIHKPAPVQQDDNSGAPATSQVSNPLASIISDDDASIGNGPEIMVVFMDYGDIAMRQQVIPLFAFAIQHPDWKVDIKELPLLNQESVDIALSQVAVVQQQDEAAWRKYEFLLIRDKGHMTPAKLRDMAQKAGVNMTAYDDALKSGSALKKIKYNREMAQAAKIQGTPFFVINGKYRKGYMSLNDLNVFAVP